MLYNPSAYAEFKAKVKINVEVLHTSRPSILCASLCFSRAAMKLLAIDQLQIAVRLHVYLLYLAVAVIVRAHICTSKRYKPS